MSQAFEVAVKSLGDMQGNATHAIKVGKSEVTLTTEADKPLVAMAFKTVVESFGQLTLMRVYQGQVRRGLIAQEAFGAGWHVARNEDAPSGGTRRFLHIEVLYTLAVIAAWNSKNLTQQSLGRRSRRQGSAREIPAHPT